MLLPGKPELVDDGLDPLHPLLVRDVWVHAHHGLEDERLAHRQRPDEEVVLLHVPGHRRQRVRRHRHAVGVPRAGNDLAWNDNSELKIIRRSLEIEGAYIEPLQVVVGQRVEEGCFPGAGRAHQCHQLPRLHVPASCKDVVLKT